MERHAPIATHVSATAYLCICLFALSFASSAFGSDGGTPDANHHRHRRAVLEKCSGQEYNTSQQRCCQGSIVNIPSSLQDSSVGDISRYAWCCASSSYDIRTSLCCGGSLRPDVVSKAERGNYRCCGSDAIDMRKTKCCGSAGKPLGDVPAERASCCAGEPFDNQTTACCADIKFNTTIQLCCQGSITADGGVKTHMCCGAVSYSLADIQNQNLLCCEGQVFENTGDAKCCGPTMYHPSSGEGCCNNEIFDTSQDTCCSGRELRYGFPATEYECCAHGLIAKSSETMCCDRTIVPGRIENGYACCERDSYKLGAQVCCGAPGSKKVEVGSDCTSAQGGIQNQPNPSLGFLSGK